MSSVPEALPITQAAPVAERDGTFVSFPGSPFQLYQPYAPAGDQPAAIAARSRLSGRLELVVVVVAGL